MTDDRLPLAELLTKAGDGDFLRSVAEAVMQLLMETDVDGLIGAGRHERTGERTTYRNGYRDRTLDTRLGSLQLRIQEAWISGVSSGRGTSGEQSLTRLSGQIRFATPTTCSNHKATHWWRLSQFDTGSLTNGEKIA